MVFVTTTGLRADGSSPTEVPDIAWAIAAGTANAITAAYDPENAALTDGLILGFRASAANTTATPTFTPDGLTSHTIVKHGGTALVAGDIPGQYAECLVRYNLANTRWELLNPAMVVSQSGILVTTYGATGDGITDDTAAIAAAWAAAIAMSEQPQLVFPAGTYVASAFPNFAVDYAKVIGIGEVRLRYTGTSHAIFIDGGTGAVGVTNLVFGPFIIECPKTADNALRLRNVNSSLIDRVVIKGAGWEAGVPGHPAIYVLGCVLTTFVNPTVYPDAGGVWYNSAVPLYGMLIDQLGAGAQTSYCTIIGCSMTATYGIYCLNALGNTFIGGAAQSCTETGVYLDTGSNRNRFIGFDSEQNTVRDFFVGGVYNELISCDAADLILVSGSAIGARIVGGTYHDIVVGTATGTFLGQLTYNRQATSGTISDSGTSTIKRDCWNAGTVVLDTITYQMSAATYAKLGGSGAGWVIDADTALPLVTLPASQTSEVLLIPLAGLQVGDQVVSVGVVGQIESAGNTVTATLDVRKVTSAAADITDASLGTDTLGAGVTADTILSVANLGVTGLTEVIAANEMLYITLTATTAADTDIAIMGLSVSVRRHTG